MTYTLKYNTVPELDFTMVENNQVIMVRDLVLTIQLNPTKNI